MRDWILNKTPELKHLSMSDALLAKIVIDIKREATGHEFVSVPLYSLASIHPINRDTAVEKVNLRIKAIEEHKESLISARHITNEALKEIMPSVSPIQVIRFEDGYIAFEGNGRLVALQSALRGDRGIGGDGFTVEVEEYKIPADSKIPADIIKLQEMFDALHNSPQAV